MKLAGEFEFLGVADKGDPRFDAPPPAGVVKVYHLGRDVPRDRESGGEPNRCGFFRCGKQRFEAFKRANSSWNNRTSWGVYNTLGSYPVAYTTVIPDKSEADRLATLRFFDVLTGGNHGFRP